MTIQIKCHWGRDWSAIDADTYDGAEDGTRHCGIGGSEREALESLLEIFEDNAHIYDAGEIEALRQHIAKATGGAP
jgi:hypothetical protein